MDTPNLAEPRVVASRVRMIMGDRKLSRKKLAEQTGISRPSLGNKLDGQVEFTYDELRRLVSALGVDWEELLSAPFDGEAPSLSPPRLRDLRSRPDRSL